MVHELAKEFAGRMECKVVNYQDGDSPQRIKRYGLEQHGMVIVDQADTKAWAESGHKQQKNAVVAAIQKVLGS
ncbi:MAG: hypothetical protein IPK26_14515 [Planctomycetes bacterium]|nr:hypothetical protein [Planctomycetota bacterium]